MELLREEDDEPLFKMDLDYLNFDEEIKRDKLCLDNAINEASKFVACMTENSPHKVELELEEHITKIRKELEVLTDTILYDSPRERRKRKARLAAHRALNPDLPPLIELEKLDVSAGTPTTESAKQ